MAKQNVARKAETDKPDTDQAAAPPEWSVRDLNAGVGEARQHQPVKGVRYDLTGGAFTKMPQAHAVKFLGDPSFEVRNENDERVATIPQNAQLRTGDKLPVLGRSETIATFDELTGDALLRRAQLRPGGEDFDEAIDREILVAFLSGPEKPRLVRGRNPDSLPAVEGEDEVAAEDMPSDEAADILGGR